MGSNHPPLAEQLKSVLAVAQKSPDLSAEISHEGNHEQQQLAQYISHLGADDDDDSLVEDSADKRAFRTKMYSQSPTFKKRRPKRRKK
jgi:hypothetical protein